MSSEVWQATDSPTVLLRLLEQRGEQRRLRLIACCFFRRLLTEFASRIPVILERVNSTRDGWTTLLQLAEQIADAPDDTAPRDALRLVRTELSIDCQALTRVMMQRTTVPLAGVVPGQPPLALLPRLVLVAAVGQFLLRPSPLAEAPLDPATFGEPLEIEVPILPAGHPREAAEQRVEAVLNTIPEVFAAITALLEGLTALEGALILSADGATGPPPNLQNILGELRMQSTDEMVPLLQAALQMGGEPLRDLLQTWMRGLGGAEPATGSHGFVQAWGLGFVCAALATVESESPSLDSFNAAERDLTRTIREMAGNPYRPARLDPMWIHRDDQRVGKLAQAIYEEQRFVDLPILGDALEEAGCPDRDILDALREPSVPFRGWWLLDALRTPAETTQGRPE
jgi:hypothetical protein